MGSRSTTKEVRHVSESCNDKKTGMQMMRFNDIPGYFFLKNEGKGSHTGFTKMSFFASFIFLSAPIHRSSFIAPLSHIATTTTINGARIE